jgi:hypothetical protein
MKIYEKEIEDGVSDLVKAQSSVAYCSQALLYKDSGNDSLNRTARKILASSANPQQIDLYYITSVLVSTGWNKNDDVFEASQTWAARNTPEDKQFNFMHNENDIIGHITGSYIVDKEGNRIESQEAPDEFDIITEAVLYNSWTNEENRDRMKQIIAEIEEGKWFVSMECLFAGFDYSLLDQNGSAKALERNQDSAFLTKHLRAYGGTGEYEGYKVGRLLRDISFSGKGLVSKPANPRSIILDSSRAYSLNDITLTTFSQGEDIMADNSLLEKQLADIQSELASAKEENKALRAEIAEAASKETLESIAKLEATLGEKEEAIKALEASLAEKETSVTELQESIAKSEEEMKDKMEELNKMKKEKKMEARKAALLELGFEAEEAEESIASYESFDDATFEAIIAAMTKMDKKKAAVKKDEEDKEKAAMPKKNMAEEVEAEEAEAEAEAEEALAEVETTEATLVDASDETDELQATRASVAEWLETNVLRK